MSQTKQKNKCGLGCLPFDMERMKLALSSPSIEIPRGLSRDEIKAFLLNEVKKFKN